MGSADTVLGMWALLWTFLETMRSLFRTQRELALENLATRQQVAALIRTRGGRRLRLGCGYNGTRCHL